MVTLAHLVRATLTMLQGPSPRNSCVESRALEMLIRRPVMDLAISMGIGCLYSVSQHSSVCSLQLMSSTTVWVQKQLSVCGSGRSGAADAVGAHFFLRKKLFPSSFAVMGRILRSIMNRS